MRFTFLSMISTGSLSAFSTANTGSVGPTPGPQARKGVEKVRAAQPAGQDKQTPLQAMPPKPDGGRPLPRGSLLNLAV